MRHFHTIVSIAVTSTVSLYPVVSLNGTTHNLSDLARSVRISDYRGVDRNGQVIGRQGPKFI